MTWQIVYHEHHDLNKREEGRPMNAIIPFATFADYLALEGNSSLPTKGGQNNDHAPAQNATNSTRR